MIYEGDLLWDNFKKRTRSRIFCKRRCVTGPKSEQISAILVNILIISGFLSQVGSFLTFTDYQWVLGFGNRRFYQLHRSGLWHGNAVLCMAD